MNKQEFMDVLRRSLADLPSAERDEILYDYEEHFRIGISEGKPEHEIAASLGDPRTLAKQFSADYHVTRAEAEASVSNTFSAVLATLGLGFFNLVFVLGPFLGLLGVLFGFFVASGAIVLSGIAVLAATFFGAFLPVGMDAVTLGPATPVAAFFLAIGLICLGLLLLIGNVYLVKYFFIGTVKYLKFNLKIIRGVER